MENELESNLSGDMQSEPESELVPDSVAPDSEMVPYSLPPGAFFCARCHRVHEDRQAWDHAHSRLWPCSRCGIVHMEYMVLTMLYAFNEFDSEVFIPDLDKVVMHGNTIKFDYTCSRCSTRSANVRSLPGRKAPKHR